MLEKIDRDGFPIGERVSDLLQELMRSKQLFQLVGMKQMLIGGFSPLVQNQDCKSN